MPLSAVRLCLFMAFAMTIKALRDPTINIARVAFQIQTKLNLHSGLCVLRANNAFITCFALKSHASRYHAVK